MVQTKAVSHEEIRDSVIPQLEIPLSQHLVGIAHADTRIGSGTLIKSSERYGILTAHHVIHKPKPALFKNGQAQESLVLVIQERMHRFELQPLEWTCHDIGVPPKEGHGPDVCFVEIFSCDKLDTLKARKSFFSLDHEPEKRLGFCQDDSSGFFAVACFIHEHTKTEERPNGREDTTIKPWIYSAGLQKDFAMDGGFDYGDRNSSPGAPPVLKEYGDCPKSVYF